MSHLTQRKFDRMLKAMGQKKVPSPDKPQAQRPSVALCIPYEELVYAKWVIEAFTPIVTQALHTQDYIVNVEGAFIDTARRTLAEQALETDAQYLFWMDTDNVPPKHMDVIGRLLAHNKDIVGGWYNTKKQRHPCAYDLAGFNAEKDWREYRPRAEAPTDPNAPQCKCGKQHADTLEKVDGLGFGCMLIHRRVFEAFEGKKWFSTQYGTEDLYFEYEAKQLGFETYVDWGIHAAHLGIFAA